MKNVEAGQLIFGIDELRQIRQPFRTLLITLQYVKDIFEGGSEENEGVGTYYGCLRGNV